MSPSAPDDVLESPAALPTMAHPTASPDGDAVALYYDVDGRNQLYRLDPATGELAQWSDGETLLFGSDHEGQMNVYRHDLPTGESERVTDYDRAVMAAALPPDCERVAYATNESDGYDNYDVYVADADGSNPRNLEVGETGAESAPADWHPDGDALLVSDNTTDTGRCGVYDLSAGE